MKHLILAVAIALLSTPAATTAWSQQTTPTEQETKDFIAKTMKRCEHLKGAQFRGENLHLINTDSTWNLHVPVHELDIVGSGTHISRSDKLGSNFTQHMHLGSNIEYLKFTCKGLEGACVKQTTDKGTKEYGKYFLLGTCPEATNSALEKAFNHLIGIYKARNPKPLFE